MHFCNEGGGNASRTSKHNFDTLKLADRRAWHSYGMEWTPESITFTIDNIPTSTVTAEQTHHTFGEGCKTFHLIIDQQIGGGWVENNGAKGIDQQTLARKGAVLEIAAVRVWSAPEFRHPTMKKTGSKPKEARAAKETRHPRRRKGK